MPILFLFLRDSFQSINLKNFFCLILFSIGEEDNEGDEEMVGAKSDGEDSDESSENVAKWKENMKLNAQLNFEKNQVVNWNSLVYGKDNKVVENERNKKQESDNDDDNDFFKVNTVHNSLMQVSSIF